MRARATGRTAASPEDGGVESSPESRSKEQRRLPVLSILFFLAVVCVVCFFYVPGSASQIRFGVPPAPPIAKAAPSSDAVGVKGAVKAGDDRSKSDAKIAQSAPAASGAVVATMTVGEAMKQELQSCRTAKPAPEDEVLTEVKLAPGEAQMLDSLRCIFGLLYPAEATKAATYDLHTSHPENIYGEIPPESVSMIISELGLRQPGGVFYDLGSGVGRMTLQVYLTTEAAKSYGVEIAVPRHELAVKALKALQRAELLTLLPATPPLLGDRKAEFMATNITEIDMSDATGIYMASLFFPKELMWELAEKFSKLKKGTKILTLVKFPFDVYGHRKLPKDSPMQALRLRKSFSNIRMTWSEENNVFLYEVDKDEAFPAAFDAPAATTRQLLDEVYRRSKIERGQFETPEFADAVLAAVESLQLGAGDEICEVGVTSGWMSLYLALESKVDKVFSASIFDGNVHDMPVAKARATLEDLAPGRIPWHRRVEFAAERSLQKFIHGDTGDATGSELKKDFAYHCGSASVVVLHPMRSYEEGLDALGRIADVLPAGTVVLALGMEMMKHFACSYGLLPLLQGFSELPLSSELNLPISLDVFAVAPKEKVLASMGLPGFGSLQEAVGKVGADQVQLQRLVAEKLAGQAAPTDGGDVLTTGITQASLRSAVDTTRFARLQLVLAGVTAAKNGALSFHSESSSSHRRYGGEVHAGQLAKLWLARFFGGSESSYACLEANLYALASYAPAITKREKKAGLFPEQSAVYGEVDPKGLDTLIFKLGGLKSTDTFFDLGSGLGKAVLQIFVSTPAARVVGVELGEARHQGAAEALNTMRHRFPTLTGALEQTRSIELRHEDVLKTELKDATVVWMGSLAFPRELMAKIAGRLLEHTSIGCRVVTMLEFPPVAPAHKRQLLQKEVHKVAVRWAAAKEAKVYMYEIAQAD